MPSFNDCLTQEDQEELVAIRNGLDILFWRTGDIANRNYDRMKDDCSFAYVCQQQDSLWENPDPPYSGGRGVAEFYTDEWRTKYAGLLSFDHFSTAMTYPDWQARLERAAFGGRNEEPMTVDQMNAEFIRGMDGPENFPITPSAVVCYEESIPSVQLLGKPDGMIQTILGLISRLSDSLGLNDERRAKVYYAMNLLQEALCVPEHN